ncbi:MAG: hypothetical protein ACP5GX_11860 [Anaerolineae bacterium]
MSQGKLAKIQQSVINKKFWPLGWDKIVVSGIFLVCLGLLAYKAYSSWETLLKFEWKIRYVWFVPLSLLFIAQTLTVVWGWWSILGRLTHHVPFRKHVKVYCYTVLARRIPAGLLWMIAGRAYWYRQLDIPVSISTVASFLELGLVILAGLPIGALQMGVVASLQPRYVLVIFGLTVAIAAVLIQPCCLNQIWRFLKRRKLGIILSYQDSLRWTWIYILVWLLSGTGLYIVVNLFYALPVQSIPEIIGVWTLASLVSYFTLLTPSGLGVKELSLTFLLGFYLPEPLPLVVALAARILWTVYEIIAGLVSLVL